MDIRWVVEGYLGGSDNLERVPLRVLPAVVGREAHAEITIPRPEVSRHHAQFFEDDGRLMLRDLGSTNGTFVNHEKIHAPTRLADGDVVHFAGCEVRVLAQGLGVSRENQESKTTLNAMPLSDRLPMGLNDLRALIAKRSIRAEFQPIVSPAGNLHAFEILGRGDSTRLPREPYGLFRIAESMPGLAIKLSEIMRECGITQALEQSDKHRLFVNTHPLELGDMDSLLSDMERLRGKFPKSDLVLEVHEDAVTDPASMQRFGHALKQLDIALAFDDFGSGQARLLELVDVPIAYVKFDISMIRGLDRAPDARRHLVRSLVGLTASMGIMSLAEGVETRSELSACAEAGFELIQGFIFARPSATMAYSPN